MTGSKWCTTIKCIRAFFVAVLLLLIIVGIILYTKTNIPSFISIILIATPALVVLTVLVLYVNNYCHANYSHSFGINGLTDGLEFDDLAESLYGERHSRRHSFASSRANRHSLYDQHATEVLDSIPDDVSDDEHEYQHGDGHQGELDHLTTPHDQGGVLGQTNGSHSNSPRGSQNNIPNEVVIEIDDTTNGNNTIRTTSEVETQTIDEQDENPENLHLPTYQDAISNYGDDEGVGSLPSYQEALNEESVQS